MNDYTDNELQLIFDNKKLRKDLFSAIKTLATKGDKEDIVKKIAQNGSDIAELFSGLKTQIQNNYNEDNDADIVMAINTASDKIIQNQINIQQAIIENQTNIEQTLKTFISQTYLQLNRDINGNLETVEFKQKD